MSDEMDMEEGGVVKKFMFLNRKAPYGTVYALGRSGSGADFRCV